MDEALVLDPGVVTFIGGAFLEHLKAGISIISQHAFNLLYIFAVFELVLFGLLWALQRDLGVERLFIKVLKIGVVFFVISQYDTILQTFIDSFLQISRETIDGDEIAQYIFNPAQLWQYGYDAGVALLKLATTSTGFGVTLLTILLGFGILFVIGLLGIQLVVQLVAFYFVAFGGLILMPLGVFNPTKRMFDQVVRSILQAGLRLLAVVIVISVAVLVWDRYNFDALEAGSGFNLNQPLGLFFTGMLFLNLAIYLPKVVERAVGEMGGLLERGSSTVVTNGDAVNATSLMGGASGIDQGVLAATTIVGSNAGNASLGGMETVVQQGANSGTVSGNSASGQLEGKMNLTGAAASKLTRSISDATVKKIKEKLAND